MTSNKPTETIRDGLLQATIWKNQAEKGEFYSVQLTRRYQDEAGNYRDSDSCLRSRAAANRPTGHPGLRPDRRTTTG